jgi:hypothetical protein
MAGLGLPLLISLKVSIPVSAQVVVWKLADSYRKIEKFVVGH